MEDKNYLYNAYNATSTDDGNGELETYENWLERQLLSRIEKLEQLALTGVGKAKRSVICYQPNVDNTTKPPCK